MASLLLATGAAVLFMALWRFWYPEPEVPPPTRFLSDVVLSYQCPRKHTLRMRGQARPPICDKCGQLSYVRARYWCRLHGVYEVALKFAKDSAGVLRVSELQLPGRAWVGVAGGLRCPKCQRELKRLPQDPLGGVAEPDRRGRD